MRIGIVGAGAIGLTFAAALTRVHDVTVLARRSVVAELLQRDGITVRMHDGERRAPVRATVDPAGLRECDAVIVAVKAYATAPVATALVGVLTAPALVASVQNGIGNVETLRAALGGVRVIAGSTMLGAISVGDGAVRSAGDGRTTFARDDAAVPTSDDLAAAFEAAGLPAHVVADGRALLWRKLVVNAAINPACALADRANGAVLDDPDLGALARALAVEAAAVANAEGIAIDDPWALVQAAAAATAANRNSMLADLLAGRPTEVDAISGTLTGLARRHGIAVPATATVLRLVRARERR